MEKNLGYPKNIKLQTVGKDYPYLTFRNIQFQDIWPKNNFNVMSRSETSTDPQKTHLKQNLFWYPPVSKKKGTNFQRYYGIYIALLALCLPLFSGGLTQARYSSFCLERATALSITKFYHDTTPKYIFSLDLGHFENKIWRFFSQKRIFFI